MTFTQGEAQTAAQKLQEKLEKNYSERLRVYMATPTENLIANAEEIAVNAAVVKHLTDELTDAACAYFLRFKDPLQVICDFVRSCDIWTGWGGMAAAVLDLCDDRSDEEEYEMEE